MVDFPILPSVLASLKGNNPAVGKVNALVQILNFPPQLFIPNQQAAILHATVIPTNLPNRFTLDTNRGPLIVETHLPLKQSDTIDITIDHHTHPPQLRLSQINGQPVTRDSLAQLLLPALTNPSPRLMQQLMALPLEELATFHFLGETNNPLSGRTVQQPTAEVEPTIVASPLLTIGDELPFTVSNPNNAGFAQLFAKLFPALPQETQQQLLAQLANIPSSYNPSAPSYNIPGSPSNTPQPTNQPATFSSPLAMLLPTLFSAGTTLTAQLVTLSLPNQTNNTTKPPPSPTTHTQPSLSDDTVLAAPLAPFTDAVEAPPPTTPQRNDFRFHALVVGQEKSGDTVLHSSLGTLKLALSQPLPKDTVLELALTNLLPPTTVAAATTTPITSPQEALIRLFSSWSSADALVQAVKQNMPEQLNALQQFFPSPNHPLKPLGGAFEQFLLAATQGRLRQILPAAIGKGIKESGKEALLEIFTQEATLATQSLATPLPVGQENSWVGFMIPLLEGEDIHPIRFFVRDHEDSDDSSHAKEASHKGRETRFIVELDSTFLGPLQLDGLFRVHPESPKQFDLFFRSHAPIPNDMRNDIQRIFQDTLDITGLKGQLVFQTHPEFPVSPLQEMLRGAPPPGSLMA